MRRVIFILAALIFSTGLAACGQKGPLKLPQDNPTPAPKVTAAGTAK
ncbi:MAG: lipoprotein [Burkholderiales bacterium]|nr:lipoprotein [Burkholderiales bacterium]